MNLVGHVAVALRPGAPAPSTEFLVGCMLPDLAAIARVRVARPEGTLGDGVAFHHACDAVFHESDWFRGENRRLRDVLLDAGVDTGAARACSHAGVEMLLDGALVRSDDVLDAAQLTLDAVCRDAHALAELAPVEARSEAAARFRRIGSSLEPARYTDARFVAERLHAMTRGRRRIELAGAHVDVVAAALDAARPGVGDSAPSVVAGVRDATPVVVG